jgi:hypothetical protein
MSRFIAVSEVHIDTSALDCIQANLGYIGNAVHGISTEARLGSSPAFCPRAAGDAPLPTIEPPVLAHLQAAERLLGLRHTAPRAVPTIRDLATGLDADGWTFLIADAFELPWVPYHRQTHTGHSFVLRPGTDGVQLIDAYTNDTPWGQARPKIWTFRPDTLRTALPDVPATAVTIRPGPLPGEPATGETVRRIAGDLAEAAEDGRVETYIGAYAAHPDQAEALTRFTVETWLLARQRVALTRWLEGRRGASVDLDGLRALGGRWLEASEATYLAMRRAQRGRPVPGGVIERVGDLLESDGAVLSGCAEALGVSA